MSTIPMRIPGAGRELLRLAIPAAIVVMAMNAGLFLLGVLLGLFPLAFAPTEGAMTLAPVLLVSALGVLGGLAVYASLRSRVQAPLRVFTMIAVPVLLASFVGPILVAAWSLAQIVLLNVMHVMVAAVTVFTVVLMDEEERDAL